MCSAIGFAMLLLSICAQSTEAQSNTFPSTGNVGIGTQTPAYPLHVEGASTDPFYAQGYFKNTSSVYPYGGVAVDGISQSHIRFLLGGALKWQWRVGAATGVDDLRAYNWALGSDVLTLKNNGNAGIGTSNPNPLGISSSVYGRVLTIANPTAGARPLLELWTNAAPSDGQTIGQVSFLSGTSPTNVPAAAILSTSNGPTANTGDLKFLTSSASGTIATRMTIDFNGNVGIGRTNPTAALDILGDIKVSGNINAKYQDVAEWVETSQALPAGTVVVLDHTKSNQVVASLQAYDTRVAGVISAQPGIALGESGDNKVLVATTGRVRVKVDASKSPIHIGDLLVTSKVPGVAMKSEPLKVGERLMHMPGTLIGKALEPLEKGSGKILVLLSLQ
jgi:hypothetical protein